MRCTCVCIFKLMVVTTHGRLENAHGWNAKERMSIQVILERGRYITVSDKSNVVWEDQKQNAGIGKKTEET